jgi:hypothetical protein
MVFFSGDRELQATEGLMAHHRFRSLAVLALFSFLPSAALADCDLLRTFNAVQGNGYTVVFDDIDVTNGRAFGPAHYFGGRDFKGAKGQADGSFDGLNFVVDVSWATGGRGHYEGRIDPNNGQMKGATKDPGAETGGFQAKVNWVAWHSTQTFNCVAELGVSPATAARCATYADTGKAQNDENVSRHCGFTGPRWTSDRGSHEGWCKFAPQSLADSETAERQKGLSQCRRVEFEVGPGQKFKDLIKP